MVIPESWPCNFFKIDGGNGEFVIEFKKKQGEKELPNTFMPGDREIC